MSVVRPKGTTVSGVFAAACKGRQIRRANSVAGWLTGGGKVSWSFGGQNKILITSLVTSFLSV